MNNKTNIFILLGDITLEGGVERVVVNMANHLAVKEYHTTIVSLFKRNNAIHYKLHSSITVKYLLSEKEGYHEWKNKQTIFNKSNLLLRLRISQLYTPQLYALIDEKSDTNERSVVLCNTYLWTPLYSRRNTLVIGLDHSRYPFGKLVSGLHHYITTFLCRSVDIVTTLNVDEVWKWKSLGCPVYVMPNFLADEFARSVPKDCTTRKNVIISLGRMNTPQKGFDRLIDAYSLIAQRYKDWKLLIYGCGNLKEQYLQAINKRKLSEYIEIRDFTTTPLLVYQEASIYAMCSRCEGFPMVLLEAGSQGLPIVAYDVEFGPRAIVKNGETGYLVADGDSKAFADRLEELINTPTLRRNMSEKIRKDIPMRYAESVIMAQWEKLIGLVWETK